MGHYFLMGGFFKGDVSGYNIKERRRKKRAGAGDTNRSIGLHVGQSGVRQMTEVSGRYSGAAYPA